ncbi:protein D3 isoform X1 [Bemisia tabaci]|uniref:protein D3 isoform X1 n=1 Tax=Bemisia tabaci TaxID=7038 RepID=UPI003B27E2F2
MRLKSRAFLTSDFVFFVFSYFIFVVKCGVNGTILMTELEMRAELERQHVVPQLIPEGPRQYLWVEWLDGKKAEYGNLLDPHICEEKPQLITWKLEEGKHHTLIFVDADKKNEGVRGENPYLHWLCVNIDGPEILQGLNVAKYHPPKPAKDTGVHRFIWFLYEQPNGRQYFEFSPIKDTLEDPSPHRANFSVIDFAQRNNLGRVLAANMFRAEYVPDPTYSPGDLLG